MFRVTWDDPTQESERKNTQQPDGLALVFKPTETQGDVVTLQAWPYAGSPALDVCYWSASGTATETLALDFDAVRVPRRPDTSLAPSSSYEDGRWHMLMQRPLRPTVPEGAAVIDGQAFTSIAFTVWDGGNAEARAVSPWIELSFAQRRRAHP